ncbi:MAG: hydrolase [Planctomycetota bacterium]|nr:MAG: hydrolase [Planctomycetota bacterium]
MILPMRLESATSVICVIDVQERLLAAMPDAERVVARSRRLAEAACLLDVKRLLTEQYPRGLGPTPAGLAALLPPPIAKQTFSCCGCEGFDAAIDASVSAVVIAGLETHVCVTQTALDLLGRGIGVFVAVDAVASRHAIDHEVALRRLESAGAVLTTSEAVLFEWCRTADHPQFQSVRRLVID